MCVYVYSNRDERDWRAAVHFDTKPSVVFTLATDDFCRLPTELSSSSSEASVLAATVASLMLNRNSVASHRKNRSLTYHWGWFLSKIHDRTC